MSKVDYLEKYLIVILKGVKSKTLNDDDRYLLAQEMPHILQVVGKTEEFVVMTNGKPVVRVNYGFIAGYVYKNQLSTPFDNLSDIDGHLDFLKETISEYYKDFDEDERGCLEAFLSKVHNHICLSIRQKSFILQSAIEAKSVADGAKEVSDEARRAADEAKSKAGDADNLVMEAQNHLKNMYGNFITILGIFTAIIITLAGGISIISSSLDFLKDPVSFIFFVSVAMLCMFAIMHFLFSWINKVRQVETTKQNQSISGIKSIVCAFIILAVVGGVISII